MSGVFSKMRGKKIPIHRTILPWFLFHEGAELVGTVEHVWRRGPKQHNFCDDGLYYQVRLLKPCQVARRTLEDDRHNRQVSPFEAKAGTTVNLQNHLTTESLLPLCEGSKLPTIKLIVHGKIVHPKNHRVLWNTSLLHLVKDEDLDGTSRRKSRAVARTLRKETGAGRTGRGVRRRGSARA